VVDVVVSKNILNRAGKTGDKNFVRKPSTLLEEQRENARQVILV
jgi:hypothetical protein